MDVLYDAGACTTLRMTGLFVVRTGRNCWEDRLFTAQQRAGLRFLLLGRVWLTLNHVCRLLRGLHLLLRIFLPGNWDAGAVFGAVHYCNKLERDAMGAPSRCHC